MFATCLVETAFPQAAIATVRLLGRLGHEVDVPAGQACCGQMHLNTGYRGRWQFAGTNSWPDPNVPREHPGGADRGDEGPMPSHHAGSSVRT